MHILPPPASTVDNTPCRVPHSNILLAQPLFVKRTTLLPRYLTKRSFKWAMYWWSHCSKDPYSFSTLRQKSRIGNWDKMTFKVKIHWRIWFPQILLFCLLCLLALRNLVPRVLYLALKKNWSSKRHCAALLLGFVFVLLQPRLGSYRG